MTWPRHLSCWPRARAESLGRLRGRVLDLVPWWSARNKNKDPNVSSRVAIIGRWTDASGEVHARRLGSGANTHPHQRGLRTFCMKPWKHMDGPHGPASPDGLRRVDFLLDFESRITCESCVSQLDAQICGPLPKRAD